MTLSQEQLDFNAEMKKAIREVMSEKTSDEQKAIFKEAIQDWLDDKYATFGRWSFNGVLAAAIGALAYFLALKSGWIPPK